MEQEASAPRMASHVQNPPGASPSPYPDDSVMDNSIKKSSLDVDSKSSDNNFGSSVGNGGASNGSDDDGFVSGEEGFETTPEKPTDGADAPSVDVSVVSALRSEEPVLPVPVNDVDDDDKVGVLKVEGVVGEKDKGLEGVKSEGLDERNGNGVMGSEDKEVVKDGEVDEGKGREFRGEEESIKDEVLEESEIGVGGNGEVENGKLLETDAVKFTSLGDSVVDDIKVDVKVSSPGVAVVGDIEESEDTDALKLTGEGDSVVEEVKVGESSPGVAVVGDIVESEDTDAPKLTGREDSVVENIKVDVKVSSPGVAVVGDIEGSEDTDALKLTGEGDSVVEEVKVGESSPGVAVVGDIEESEDTDALKLTGGEDSLVEDGGLAAQNENAGANAVGGAVGNGSREISAEQVSIGESGTASRIEGGQDLEPEDGQAADTETKVTDRAVEAVLNGLNALANDVHDGVVFEDRTHTVDSATETKQIDRELEAVINVFNLVGNDAKDGGDEDNCHAIASATESAQTQAVSEVAGPEVDQTFAGAVKPMPEDEVPGNLDIPDSAESKTFSYVEVLEDEEEEGEDEEEDEGSDDGTEGEIFGSSEAAKQFLEELERESGVGLNSGAESFHEHSQRIDGQIVTDSEEEGDTDEEGEGKQIFDSAALAALLKAASGSGSDDGTITLTSPDGSRLFSVERPAGLGSSLRSVKPAARPYRPNLFNNSSLTGGGDSDNNLSEEDRKKLETLQHIRVKFLRLVHRLGHSAEESIAAQVLYRLALIAGRQTNQLFSLDAAKRTAVQLETEGKDLDFSLNILVLGKAGVGKSATINSIFGEDKAQIHAFEPTTASVREITGFVDGVKVRVIDTPGLKPSGAEQGANRKILTSVKKFMKKCPPDIVLYVDRLDTQSRDLNDLPLLKSITSTLGSAIWRNVIVTLTHAASAPPDGPSGSPLSYDVFVAQRSHVVQHSIGQAVGDLRLMNPSLANPVSLVENHQSCRKNRDGEKVLPNGQAWRPQLMLISYSIKILSEASSLSKPLDSFDNKKLFGFRVRSPPLPYLLSWLLQSRPHPKLSAVQGGDGIDSDVDLDDLSDSDKEEEEDEYDQLPPFKPLKEIQLAKLNKEQKKAYYEEYEYRVKLLQKKQWEEELRRMKELKKNGKATIDELGDMGEDVDAEDGAPAAVPVPLPEMVLPPTFDGDNPAYRYRFLEPTSRFLARPVLDTHGWDHDCGYDGVNVEHSLAIINQFPAAVTVQVTKDKKEFNIHLDSSVSGKHGDKGSTMAGFDIQNVGKQLAYILRGETKFKTFRKNKTTAGFSVTFLGENVATGLKMEDQIGLGKRLTLVGSTGTVRSKGDSAYGANLEVRLREPDYPIGQDQSSLGLSLVKWKGDLALGANLQSQFSIGRSSKIAVRAGLNNKMTGQITVRTSSSDQLQLALVGLLPIAMSIYKAIRPGISENYMY
ncbi:hypothetical protein Tsubulata_014091 [Turnera subulata]|uniref:AIG1-type G domain-containing protein n=1 Tax=Turnera subulata TaxID=218843 RepID=A0A9Q0JM26_9ROSI|nr:hypothetical protein Tsubulata_014091 [Turnera subulata]